MNVVMCSSVTCAAFAGDSALHVYPTEALFKVECEDSKITFQSLGCAQNTALPCALDLYLLFASWHSGGTSGAVM